MAEKRFFKRSSLDDRADGLLQLNRVKSSYGFRVSGDERRRRSFFLLVGEQGGLPSLHHGVVPLRR